MSDPDALVTMPMRRRPAQASPDSIEFLRLAAADSRRAALSLLRLSELSRRDGGD